jgi:DNA (cytosine-5)-methyltransferase 1
MVAMTSGIDVRCLQDSGFSVQSILEYRPQEARDSRDLTESGVMTVLANGRPRFVFNEDISTINWGRVRSVLDQAPPMAVLHASLQCDDFSTAKSRSLKQRSLDDLTTSADLVFDALRMIETVAPAVAIFEQVPGFSDAPEGSLLKTKLRKWGYNVTEQILRGDDFGGKTRRSRMYLVASVFPGFEMPAPAERRSNRLWDDIAPFLECCRDVSHTKSLLDGIANGRARLITPASLCSPTILKSQQRQVKDSVYIEMPDGRYLLPSLELLQFLNGIPSSFSFDSVAGEQCAEQIGQSIDFPMHEAVCKAVHRHIGANVGRHSVVTIVRQNP